MEKVSIIVPVYNGAKVLKRCVDSILKQDFENFELLLVNDGSSDASQEIAEAYAARDKRVHAIYKENGGVSSARNRGIEEAAGEYIQFVDVDDWLPMESTKLLLREMQNGKPDLVISDFYRVIDGNVSQKGSIEKGGMIDRRKYADAMMRSPADLYYGVLWNKLYRKDIIDTYHIRMDEKVSYSEDMIFNLEYLLHAQKISVLKAPVYYYIKTKGSLVEKNMNLASAIKMKKNVIGYYSQFYKSVLDERSYQERLPVIYGYLVSFSTDALSVPFAPGTKKLGEEREAEIHYSNRMESSVMFGSYLSICLITRYMNTIAAKHALELNEVKILYFLWKMDGPCSIHQIGAFTGIGQIAATMSIARLLVAGMISRSGREEGKRREHFVMCSLEMERELQEMERDFDRVCFEGASGEDRKAGQNALNRITENIRRHIAADDEPAAT